MPQKIFILPQKIQLDKASLSLARRNQSCDSTSPDLVLLLEMFFLSLCDVPEFHPSTVSHLCYFRPGVVCTNNRLWNQIFFLFFKMPFPQVLPCGFQLVLLGSGEEKRGGFCVRNSIWDVGTSRGGNSALKREKQRGGEQVWRRCVITRAPGLNLKPPPSWVEAGERKFGQKFQPFSCSSLCSHGNGWSWGFFWGFFSPWNEILSVNSCWMIWASSPSAGWYLILFNY